MTWQAASTLLNDCSTSPTCDTPSVSMHTARRKDDTPMGNERLTLRKAGAPSPTWWRVPAQQSGFHRSTRSRTCVTSTRRIQRLASANNLAHFPSSILLGRAALKGGRSILTAVYSQIPLARKPWQAVFSSYPPATRQTLTIPDHCAKPHQSQHVSMEERNDDQPDLVAGPTGPEAASPACAPVRSHGREIRLRRGGQGPRRRRAEARISKR